MAAGISRLPSSGDILRRVPWKYTYLWLPQGQSPFPMRRVKGLDSSYEIEKKETEASCSSSERNRCRH